MRICPYNDANYISLYVDGKLSEEETRNFEFHLQSCDECLNTVMALVSDLNGIEKYLEGTGRLYAVFVLLNGVMKLKGQSVLVNFTIEKSAQLKRGGNRKEIFKTKLGGVKIFFGPDDVENNFIITLYGVSMYSIMLLGKGKLIEAKDKIEEDVHSINRLPKGNYLLVIEKDGVRDRMEFKVL